MSVFAGRRGESTMKVEDPMKVEVYCRYITVKGRVLDAYEYNKKCWHFFVAEDKHKEYLDKKLKH